MQFQSLGQEVSLEEEMTTHSMILAWKMDRGSLQSTVNGVAKTRDMTPQLSMHPHLSSCV